MKQLYYFAMCLLFGCFAIVAQPCSDFNDPSNPAGNWGPAPYPNGNVIVGSGSPNALDGTQYLTLTDDSGSSWFQNTVDYHNIGEIYYGQCLCFDFYLENSGGFSGMVYPSITLSDGSQSITFVSSIGVTQGSGWVRICAPLLQCDNNTLPSNATGTWTMAPGMGCDDFNSVLFGSTILGMSSDLTSNPSEIMYIDNICIRPSCSSCSADFKLDTSFSTLSNSTTATLTVINPQSVSTPGNPGSIYRVNWGDGSPEQIYPLSALSHNYAASGSYTVCVTEMKSDREVICRRCFTFCYRRQDTGNQNPDHPGTDTGTGIMYKSMIQEKNAIAEAELNNFSGSYRLVPNPANDFVDIHTNLAKDGKVDIRVIDISGKVILERSENIGSGRQNITLNTKQFSAGVYIIEMKSGNKTTSKKLLISK